ncbi:MAG: glycosyltransferase [candidate division Zixibacteria bacterium]|nr:glycosyltransferase [candidate division Zixibacteria bacterium]
MIAIITHNYPTDDNPVAGLFVQDHAEILRRETGGEVEILYYPFGEYPMTKSIKKPWKWPKFIRYFWGTSKRLKADIDRMTEKNDGVRPDIIANWWFPNGTFAAEHFDNVDVICHGTDLYQLQKFSLVARYYAKRAKKVRSWRCVSTDLKRILLELYPFIDESIVTVSPMPIGPMFVNRSEERDPNLIVTVGSLISRKQFDLAIKEVAKIPGMKLEIYGEGPEKMKLKDLIRNLGVTDRIALKGQVTREQLADRYNRATLLIMLSYGEGFGLVLKEAQACGCKTLVFKGDGMEDTEPDYAIGRDENVSERIKQAVMSTNGLPWSGGNQPD